ncbi:peptidase T [Erwinia psidii]|uniref:Peptidase T n=1 Tax=Erwinia psidii TaxID=69224 RepID=A0A3N6SJ61_9GAMM|nr:peptidase T [Erwinia psidii]MCX8955802.1 peptidase T [Erwinia psidii]MCX8961641.1 peptidase T [Erwinia psidii]MCX8965741.1 peptidase T [Erwinia psidii]RQM37636.1 peptidase T [Erwinia psidii]
MNNLLDRFLQYVSYDTQSRSHVRQIPSTEGQLQLAKVLCRELTALGLSDVTLSKNGIVMATLPSNVAWPVPTIGFISHIDTSPDYTAKNVTPQIVENYRGGDIALGIGDEILSPVMFPVLHSLIGHTLITTDGKTLLGADDKAGIAEIVTAMARLKKENIPHGNIRIAFTPDEEIGKGTSCFDVAAFGAEWGYTVDGGGVGEFEYENFNAASATVKITGNNVHPGTAKGVMVNALTLAMRFHAAMPEKEVPEHTAGYEGFYHLHGIKGGVEKAELHYIIRDFDRDRFAQRKNVMTRIAAQLAEDLPSCAAIEVNIDDGYFNMREKVEAWPHIIEYALEAMRECDIEPNVKPVRGGTDGAALSFMGLPCPNLFTGGYNYHGRHEFASLDNMEKAVAVIMRIAALTARKAKTS